MEIFTVSEYSMLQLQLICSAVKDVAVGIDDPMRGLGFWYCAVFPWCASVCVSDCVSNRLAFGARPTNGCMDRRNGHMDSLD